MYSGVPKAGAPERMSTLEVKVPITHGAPGLITCSSTIAASASATDCATAPAIVTGAIAPASVNGVTTTGWPRRAKRIAPSSIGQSCLSGLDELMLVKSRGSAKNRSASIPEAIRAISSTSSTRSGPRL